MEWDQRIVLSHTYWRAHIGLQEFFFTQSMKSVFQTRNLGGT